MLKSREIPRPALRIDNDADSGSATLRWRVPGSGWYSALVGQRPPERIASDIGLVPCVLTKRHIAFLASVWLDQQGLLDPNPGVRQLPRIAELLTVSFETMRKWTQRHVMARDGQILRRGFVNSPYRVPSRSGGPWWLHIEPGDGLTRTATQFVRDHAEHGRIRASHPCDLMDESDLLCARNRWHDALEMAEEAERAFIRSRLPRRDRLWYRIRFGVGGIRMQLGQSLSSMQDAHRILRGVPRARLSGPEGQVVRARAHHLAALVYNQRHPDSTSPYAKRENQDGLDAVSGISAAEGGRALADLLEYDVILRSRANREVSGTMREQIGRVMGLFDDLGEPARREQARMRLGEAWLSAEEPARASALIDEAIGSGELTLVATVIARRLAILSEWAGGGGQAAALDGLATVQAEAYDIGFSHQVEVLSRARESVRSGQRSIVA